MRKRALIIANQQYQDSRFPDLPGAAADARELEAVLSSRLVGDFEVEVVAEADARTAKKQIELFFSTAKRDDLLLLHLSCHGRRDPRNHLYFVSRDTEYDYLSATGIDAAFVNDQVELSLSGRIVLLLDCCYSGTYIKGVRTTRGGHPAVQVGEHFHGSGLAVITACSALQYAYEDNDLSSSRRDQPSVFTSAVVDGLRTGAGDVDGDGFVSVQDLFAHVHSQVSQRVADQTPELSVNRLNGSIYLTRSPTALAFGNAAAPLPRTLHFAIVRGEPWQRYGATLALERMLDSRNRVDRAAAQEGLIPLTRDADEAVRSRAQAIWRAKLPGSVPAALDDLPRSAPDRRSGRTVGIDFGTTNSSIAALDAGKPVIIPNRLGSKITPSIVGFSLAEVLVGESAKHQAVRAPELTVRSVKRKLGTDWRLAIGDQEYSAETIAALILERLRLDAEAHLGEAVTNAVITVPTYYSFAERESLQRAAEAAGMAAVRFINEPTAAALAYGLGQMAEQTILVFDLGGGTLDISLLELAEGVVEVKATAGDASLGGDDWDDALVDHLVQRCAREYRLDVSTDPSAMQRLREAAERAKIELSEATEVSINLAYLGQVDGLPVHFSWMATRSVFESITSHLLERCRPPLEQVLRDAEISADEVDHVILVGGSTRIPSIVDLLRHFTGGKNPSNAVPREEAIALGAALQAGILTGDVKDSLLLDVLSTSVGIETKGGVMTTLIKRNTTFPAKESAVFTTAEDDQSSVRVKVFQGEHSMTQDNRLIGIVELRDLPPAPRGHPQIEVTLDADANGILRASVRDLRTGRKRSAILPREAVRDVHDQPATATKLSPSADSDHEASSVEYA